MKKSEVEEYIRKGPCVVETLDPFQILGIPEDIEIKTETEIEREIDSLQSRLSRKMTIVIGDTGIASRHLPRITLDCEEYSRIDRNNLVSSKYGIAQSIHVQAI